MTTTERFAAVFSGGLPRAYGTYKVPAGAHPDAQGKIQGKAETIREFITPELWQAHLDGKKSLGIIPVNDVGMCNFGALDIDEYTGFDLAKFAEKISNLTLPLVPVRSKSGGCHAYLLADKPVSAALMRQRLGEIRDALDLPGKTEIFPKQSELKEDGCGGWINLSYHFPDTYGLGAWGVPQTLEEFLDYAECSKKDASFFTKPVAFMQVPGVTKKTRAKPEPAYKNGLEGAHYPELQSALGFWIGDNGKLSNGQIDIWIITALTSAGVTDYAKIKEYSGELRRHGYKIRDENQTKEPRKKQDKFTEMLAACSDFEYFHTGSMAKPFVRLAKNGHHEVHDLASVKGVLRLRYLEASRGQWQPKREDFNSIMDLLEARCSAGESREVEVRVAHTEDAIYIDLGDDTWRAIEIKASGWRIIDDPPVLFRRGAGALPLPVPISGGDLGKLTEIVNVNEDQFVLAAGWLLGKLNPIRGAAMPHLVFQGGPGSTKTTGASILIRMIDPSLAPLTPMPKNDEDAMLAAQDCGVFGLDNISGCRASLSDVLCCFSTGAARKVRTLYETSGLTVEQIRRPVLINGIDAGFLRGDLADRSTVLSLPKITNRRTDGEVEAAFINLHAELLGAICDAAVTGLRKLPTTVLQNPPRMAAYCTWLSACEASLPWEPGRFLSLYRAFHRETNRTLLENDQIGSAIKEWAVENLKAAGSKQEMTLAQWLKELTTLVNSPGHLRIDPRQWPASPNHFSRDLKRVLDLLLEEDLLMEPMSRGHGGIKLWRLSTVAKQRVLFEEKAA